MSTYGQERSSKVMQVATLSRVEGPSHGISQTPERSNLMIYRTIIRRAWGPILKYLEVTFSTIHGR